MALFRVSAFWIIAALFAACSTMPDRACTGDQQIAIHDELYFGMAKPKGVVSPEEWTWFLNTVVTPRFPQGLTVLQGAGQWRASDGSVVREASKLLILVHPDDESSETAVREIVDAYKARFQQEAVLRLRSVACISFK